MRDGFCPWNSATRSDKAWPHRRKFMAIESEYIERGEQRSGLVGLWGEWEAPSLARPIPALTEGAPRFCHLPALYSPESFAGLLDTDPFVFGDRFLYCGCQQHTNHHHPDGARETFLRRLAPGSLILFGSSMGNRFVLDTAFVVHDYRDYPNGQFDSLRGFVPEEYYSVTLNPQAAGNLTCDSFRAYRGATKAEGEPFSFVPCIEYKGIGFVRPVSQLPGVVRQILKQGKKLTQLDSGGVAEVWRNVRTQIEARDRSLIGCVSMRARRLLQWHLYHRGLSKKADIRWRPYKDYKNWFRTVLRDWVENLLLSEQFLERGYYQPQFIRSMWAKHLTGEDYTVDIGAMLAIELWHRLFLD